MTAAVAGPVVVVGAGLAGLRVVERLRSKGFDGELVMIGDEAHAPYDRPPLSKAALSSADVLPPKHFRDADRLAALNLRLELGRTVVALNVEDRLLELSDGASIGYGTLVIATGVRARVPGGIEPRPGWFTLRTHDDAAGLKDALAGTDHLVVLGAGFLGCEAAASARALGVRVTLIEGLPQPLSRVVGDEIGARVAELHRSAGVDLRLGRTVAAVHGGPGVGSGVGSGVESVELDDGEIIETSLVLCAIGAAPNVEWLAGSGVTVDNGVLVDEFGRTGVPGVWAVGDVARYPHPHSELPVRLEHWTNAGETAIAVADNVLAGAEPSVRLGGVPYFWSDQYSWKLQCLGLPSGSDELTVVDGNLAEGRFLAVYSRAGVVTGVIGNGTPGALMRCKAVLSGGSTLTQVLASRPWVAAPRPVVPA